MGITGRKGGMRGDWGWVEQRIVIMRGRRSEKRAKLGKLLVTWVHTGQGNHG